MRDAQTYQKCVLFASEKHTKPKKAKNNKKILKKHLTIFESCDIIYKRFAADTYAGVVQW